MKIRKRHNDRVNVHNANGSQRVTDACACSGFSRFDSCSLIVFVRKPIFYSKTEVYYPRNICSRTDANECELHWTTSLLSYISNNSDS